MAASSVTGLSGSGSAEGGFRGPGNGRNIYKSLLSPHVLTAEAITLSGSTQLVTFANPLPSPPGLTVSHTYSGDVSPSGYVVVFGNATGARAPWVSEWFTDANGNFSAFQITGTSSDVVAYVVVSVGRPPHKAKL